MSRYRGSVEVVGGCAGAGDKVQRCRDAEGLNAGSAVVLIVQVIVQVQRFCRAGSRGIAEVVHRWRRVQSKCKAGAEEIQSRHRWCRADAEAQGAEMEVLWRLRM